MKIRIGVGLGAATAVGDAARFAAFVDALEDLRFDSLWLSERLTGDAPDPLVGLALAAGRTQRLKLGTSVLVLPGRNPVVLAKELASLDVLSDGRLLPAVGLGAPLPVEHRAFGVSRNERAEWFDEAMPLMRALWTGEPVTHDGARFHVDGVSIGPKPIQQPIDIWLGGRARSELRRAGRLGDGWLPSFCTPDDVAEGWPIVTASAAEHGRAIDPEHLGALVTYTDGAIPEAVAAFVAQRRPGVDASELIASGLDGLHRRLEAFIAAGASKFVVTKLGQPDDWDSTLAELADVVLPLQT